MASSASGRLLFLDGLGGLALPLSYLNPTVTRGERYVSVAWKYLRRGARLVLAGWFLTLLVFPDEPLFGGGVLQTISLSIIGLTPVLPVLHRRAARWLLAVAAVAMHASFNPVHPALRAWLTGHPVVAAVWFYDFPLLGAALGWAWTEGYRRGDDARRYFTAMSLAGVVCFAAFLTATLAPATRASPATIATVAFRPGCSDRFLALPAGGAPAVGAGSTRYTRTSSRSA